LPSLKITLFHRNLRAETAGAQRAPRRAEEARGGTWSLVTSDIRADICRAMSKSFPGGAQGAPRRGNRWQSPRPKGTRRAIFQPAEAGFAAGSRGFTRQAWPVPGALTWPCDIWLPIASNVASWYTCSCGRLFPPRGRHKSDARSVDPVRARLRTEHWGFERENARSVKCSASYALSIWSPIAAGVRSGRAVVSRPYYSEASATAGVAPE
jgi:hypothetical protein